MLAGVRFIPRDKLLPRGGDTGSSSSSEEERSERRKQKHGDRRKREKPQRGSDSESESESDSDREGRSSRKRRRKQRRRGEFSEDSDSSDDGQKRGGRKRKHGRGSKEKRSKGKDICRKNSSGDDEELPPEKSNVTLRKEMGLEWMTSSGRKDDHTGQGRSESKPCVEEEKPDEEASRRNPRELNPYFKDSGSGYPDDACMSVTGDQPLPSSVVGDGGVSWRLKALKRAKEQAAREGRKLDEVVEERWGSLGQLAASVAARRSAPSHAHLHAIRGRKGHGEKPETAASGEVKEGTKEVNRSSRDYLRGVSSRHPEMKKPKHDNLSWKKSKVQHLSSEDNSLISAAVRDLNKFADDGSFMDNITHRRDKDANDSNKLPPASVETNDYNETEMDASIIRNSTERSTETKQVLSANQLAAKALQLRMKGKHEEAENLLKEMEFMVEKNDTGTTMARHESGENTSRFVRMQASSERQKREEDADFHLAQRIIQNKKYSMSGRADDEYDFDDTPSKSRRRRKETLPDDPRNIPSRFLTKKESCQFCFENPSRPKHLVISIANFSYMMLPQWQPVVPGHCCILPMQHDSSTRTVDKNVWEELRNFKKCLLRMFAEQDMDVVFLETVIDLGKQRRHCLIDCIPVPCQISKQAPLYFKKAIDEAEEEWGQHEMKKVLPTSGNLHHVIPENFSYFHVEFGLDRGFAHVIDDDSNFKSSFGLNVIRGMLRLPEEDMHRRRRQESMEKQKEAVASFAKDWEPFDWTKQLD